MYLVPGDCTWSPGGCVPGPGGREVHLVLGVYLVLGGVPGPRGGGGVGVQVLPPVDRQTLVKT